MEVEDNFGDTADISGRHRQEKKELQSRITALRKTITKSDKKRKKEVADEIAKLEFDLNEKHRKELADLNSAADETNVCKNPRMCEPVPEMLDGQPTTEEKSIESEGRLTRAQRRRNKKESDDKDRTKRILEQEEVNKSGPRVTELNSINKSLRKIGLQIHNVPADGNCLYCSIKHQLEVTGRPSIKVPELRKLTATFMRQNKDEFLPFMCNDNEEPVDEGQFDKYCNDVACTKLWGGQLELRALSNALKCPIKIIQAAGPPTVQGEQFDGHPLILTYHRHLYRLGEHYNSTVILDAKRDEQDEC